MDGRPLRAKPTPWAVTNEERTAYERWWVSRVPFAAGQTHVIRVSYQQKPGQVDVAYLYSYVLGSGRAWKGPIGRLQFVMYLGLPRKAR